LSDDNLLNRPVILLDGYTSVDECGYTPVGERGAFFNDFANELLDRGYDVIYLNYEYMGNYIENNAAVLRELLVDVNEAKLQNAAQYGIAIEQNIVLGYSMGGGIARYELARMETENVPHDTRLYISMDTPHKGANVPLGIQHFGADANAIVHTLPSYMPTLAQPFTNLIFGLTLGVTNSNLDLNNFINNPNITLWLSLNIKSDFLNQILNDHSAQQFIKYHASFDATRPNPEYEALQTEYRRMSNLLGNTGYPTQCENIAIINGDANGRPTINDPVGGTLGLMSNNRSGYRYRHRFLDFEANLLRIWLGIEHGKEFKAQLSFSGQDGTQGGHVSFVRMRKWWLGIFRDDATFEHSVTGRPDYDFASGSFIRQDIQVEDFDVGGDFLGAEFSFRPNHFTFVPSVSAADINMPNGNHDNNLYLNYNLAGDATYPQVVDLTNFNVVNPNVCPFDRVYPSNSLLVRRLRGGNDRDNLSHGESDILLPNIEDFDGDGTRENRFLDNHFPPLPQNIAEFYTLNASDIRFEQREARTSCDDQFIMFDIVLVNGNEFPACEENTRYTWFIDGNLVGTRERPRYGYDVPVAEIPTVDVPITNSHTIRVVIEKLNRNTGVWLQVADVSDTYFINYIEPTFDCNGNQIGLGKVAVEKNASELIIYPNPAQTEITIQSPIKIQNIEISNGLGQVVSKTIFNSKINTLSINTLPKGIYFVKVILEDNSLAIKKLIIN